MPCWLRTAFLISIGEMGEAQIDMQQTIHSPSGAATNRSREDAAAGARSSGLAVVPADFAQLKLAPGFLVSLNVLDDPDFTGAFRIDEQGDIALPVLGTMHIAGATVSEARLQIAKKLLEEKILKDPQVQLSILEYSATEVTLIGEVASPGKYPLLVPRKLVDVLALAGGLQSRLAMKSRLRRAVRAPIRFWFTIPKPRTPGQSRMYLCIPATQCR